MTAILVGLQEPLLTTVKRRKLAWFGHVTRHDSLCKTPGHAKAFLEPTTPTVTTTTPTPGTSSPGNTDIVPIIVDVVVGILVALAIVGCVVYLFKCRKPARVEHWDDKSGPPEETVNGYDVQQTDGQGLSIAPNGSAGNPQDEHTTVGNPKNPALKAVQRQTLSPLTNSTASNGAIQPVIPPINNTV